MKLLPDRHLRKVGQLLSARLQWLPPPSPSPSPSPSLSSTPGRFPNLLRILRAGVSGVVVGSSVTGATTDFFTWTTTAAMALKRSLASQ